jgi:hypothetical protein
VLDTVRCHSPFPRERRLGVPSIFFTFFSSQSILVVKLQLLAERHPEPAHGMHATEPEHRAALTEPHQHHLDLVVRVVPRRGAPSRRTATDSATVSRPSSARGQGRNGGSPQGTRSSAWAAARNLIAAASAARTILSVSLWRLWLTWRERMELGRPAAAVEALFSCFQSSMHRRIGYSQHHTCTLAPPARVHPPSGGVVLHWHPETHSNELGKTKNCSGNKLEGLDGKWDGWSV